MNENKKQLQDLIQSIHEALKGGQIPEKIKKEIRKELEQLKAFTLDARPARIAIVGRRGAGKSSLVNAIFGEKRAEIGDVKAQTGIGRWHRYESAEGALEILDTRGLGEGGTPEEEITKKSALEEVVASIREKCPDVLLFLNKAKEISSRIDEDLQQLAQLKKTIQDIHDYDVPIVGLVTQVDELSPKSADKPPFDHPVKQKNIREATKLLEEKISEVVATPVKVIPISAYLEFENGEIVYDTRWNIDTLLDYLIEHLPNEAQMILAKLSKVKSVQKKVARRLGKSIAGITGAIGASPIPVADMPIITGLQVTMITAIALISGKKLEKRSVVEFLGALGVNVATGFVLRTIARQLVKLIPFAGSAISGFIATCGTYALCEAAIAYFIDKQSMDHVKATFEKEFEERKKEQEVYK